MSERPHSVLIPHVRRDDTHGLIGTRPGCWACVEQIGPDYARPSGAGSPGTATSAPLPGDRRLQSVPGAPRASQAPTGALSDPHTEETR
ncbi:hypothetical protein [Actinomadura sp. SCN-SB]|uniref:hypothetical protein n=1 Tax=Actinomadura sp. SCN-SB TaxID=3373092 RepID=UPI0037509A03